MEGNEDKPDNRAAEGMVNVPATQEDRHALSPQVKRRDRLRGTSRQIMAARLRERNPVCVRCAAKGVVRLWTQMDHVVPLSKGGADDDTNVQGLCDECHYEKTAEDMGYTPKPRIGLDGWPV